MTDLYKLRAEKFNSNDSIRGISGGTEYTNYYVIKANSEDDASLKFLNYLSNNTRSNNWEIESSKMLENEKDLPLEKRINILKETIQIIE